MSISLSDLQLKYKAKIVSLTAQGAAARQKLFACGLIPGAVVSVIRLAPMGDPMQVQLNDDIMLSIRKAEGNDVKVEPI